MKTCKIVDPGIVINPNGTVVVHYVTGEYPLTGEEPLLQKGYPNLAAVAQEIVELEAQITTDEAFVSLTLSPLVKASPTLANYGSAVDLTASVSLTDQTEPITFG